MSQNQRQASDASTYNSKYPLRRLNEGLGLQPLLIAGSGCEASPTVATRPFAESVRPLDALCPISAIAQLNEDIIKALQVVAVEVRDWQSRACGLERLVSDKRDGAHVQEVGVL